jgi:hypothetical protein
MMFHGMIPTRCPLCPLTISRFDLECNAILDISSNTSAYPRFLCIVLLSRNLAFGRLSKITNSTLLSNSLHARGASAHYTM